MNIKTVLLFFAVLFCFTLTACSGDAQRPIDYPNSEWSCDVEKISFSVSNDCKITKATMVDKNGETVSISFVFSDMREGKVSITNADGTETFLSGTCAYGDDMFSIFVTDIYNLDLEISATRLTFKRV